MDTTKTVYAYDADGKLIGQKILDHTDCSPISGRWQIPAGCTELEPPPPQDGYDIKWTGTAWELVAIPADPEPEQPPEPTIDELAASTWAAAKADRNATEQSGCPYLGAVLDSDQLSVQRIAIAVQAAQSAVAAGIADFTLDWTMQDNNVVTMTAEQVIGMSTALAVYSNTLHTRARELREQIDQIITDYHKETITEKEARAKLAAIQFQS